MIELPKREIKFRAWDKRKKKMIYNFFISSVGGGIWQKTGHELYPISHAIGNALMQYTGLEDKNGREIYEGDIVECLWGRGVVCFGGYLNIGGYDTSSCCYGFHVETREGNCTLTDDEYTEVIGNIFENPGLLEGNKENG